MRASILSSAVLGAAVVAAQNNPNTANGCAPGYAPGLDTVIFSVPYPYSKVMSIIGDFKNIGWKGVPENKVTLSGPDNTVGTTRTYTLLGAKHVETLEIYSAPADGPFVEIKKDQPYNIPIANNVGIYADYDALIVTSICDGAASLFNFTIHYCSTNALYAEKILHMLHNNNAGNVVDKCGGGNFTGCPRPKPTGWFPKRDDGPASPASPVVKREMYEETLIERETDAANLNVVSISTLVVVAGVAALLGL
jgi:hypothetical protein